MCRGSADISRWTGAKPGHRPCFETRSASRQRVRLPLPIVEFGPEASAVLDHATGPSIQRCSTFTGSVRRERLFSWRLDPRRTLCGTARRHPADRPRDLPLGSSDRQERANEEIDTHRRISSLHLRYSRLARTEKSRNGGLGKPAAGALRPQALGKRQLHLDQRGLLGAQIQKPGCVTHRPPGPLEPSPSGCLHDAPSLSNAISRR
jgi:hypothetical protein